VRAVHGDPNNEAGVGSKRNLWLGNDCRQEARQQCCHREIPENDSDCCDPQWRAVIAGGDRKGPMINRVELCGIASGISGWIPLGPISTFARETEKDEDKTEDEKAYGEEQEYLSCCAHHASLVPNTSVTAQVWEML